jgi:hypothetical protein
MPSIKDIYLDKTTYPDTMELDLGNGVKMPLKQWREELQTREDFTKYAQQSSAEKKQLEATLAQAQQALAQALASQGQPARHATGPVGKLDQYADDPILAPFVEALRDAKTEIARLNQTAQTHEQQYWFGQHLAAIKDIQSRDKDYTDPAKVQDLAKFAAQHGITNLELAYKLQTRDRDLDAAKKDAQAKGFEEGQKAARVPTIPSGGRPRAKTAPEIPATFGRQSEQAAVSDPEIVSALTGAA